MPDTKLSLLDCINALRKEGGLLENYAQNDIYLIQLGDEQARAFIDGIPEYGEKCIKLSKAAEIGCHALEMTGVTNVVMAVDEHFSRLMQSFDNKINEFNRSFESFWEGNVKYQLELYFGEGGTFKKYLLDFLRDDGPLAGVLKDKGYELGKYFDPTNTESFVSKFAEILNDHLGEGGTLAKLFDPDEKGSYADKLENLLKEYFGEEAGKVKQLLDPANENSPFGRIKKDMQSYQTAVQDQVKSQLAEIQKGLAEQMAGIKSDITNLTEQLKTNITYISEIRREQEERAKKEQEIVELQEQLRRSPYGGMTFQKALSAYLCDKAASLQDYAEFVGDSSGSLGTRNKKGDVIYRINRSNWEKTCTIVLEAKDEECKPDSARFTELVKELEEAKKNRGANCGILVLSLDKNMDQATNKPKMPFFRALPNKDLVVLVDREFNTPVALDVAIYYIRNMFEDESRAISELNLNAVNEVIGRITRAVLRFREIKSQLTGINNTTAKITEILNHTENEIKENIANLQKMLNVVQEGSSENEPDSPAEMEENPLQNQ